MAAGGIGEKFIATDTDFGLNPKLHGVLNIVKNEGGEMERPPRMRRPSSVK